MSERLNGWGRILMAVIPLTLLGLVALIRMSERVDNQAKAIETKANRETVEVQYRALLDVLREVQADVRELKRR